MNLNHVSVRLAEISVIKRLERTYQALNEQHLKEFGRTMTKTELMLKLLIAGLDTLDVQSRKPLFM